MADKLTELFDDFKKANPSPTEMQLFQAGLTAGAASMRARSVKVAQTAVDKNDTINTIGALPDIPTE